MIKFDASISILTFLLMSNIFNINSFIIVCCMFLKTYSSFDFHFHDLFLIVSLKNDIAIDETFLMKLRL